ncbi:MAG: disulfide bond formation protein B [Caulobacterales bacterium]
MQRVDPILRRWPVFALVASAAMLAIAHAFETFGHMVPCTLCLRQREVYWAAMAIAAAGVGLSFSPWRRQHTTRIAGLALTVTFLYGAYLAAYHAGAEWHFWPGPTTCSGGGKVSAAALTALLHGAKSTPPACDKAAWVFLGVSMAGWNFVISVKLAVWSALSAFPTRRDAVSLTPAARTA